MTSRALKSQQVETMIEVVTRPCPGCGGQSKVKVPEVGWRRWQSGMYLIQDCGLGLSHDTNERLMSGYCTPCWDRVWGEE